MATLLLAIALVVGLLLIPLGLPGLWVMVGAALLYGLAVPQRYGTVVLVVAAVAAFGAEVLEFVLAGRYARRYGGSRRAGWGAIIGGVAGAFIGVPVAIIGPVIGAFAGSFAGAFLFEMWGGTSLGPASRVATGALLGRIAAVAMKVGIGVAMASWILLTALVWGG